MSDDSNYHILKNSYIKLISESELDQIVRGSIRIDMERIRPYIPDKDYQKLLTKLKRRAVYKTCKVDLGISSKSTESQILQLLHDKYRRSSEDVLYFLSDNLDIFEKVLDTLNPEIVINVLNNISKSKGIKIIMKSSRSISAVDNDKKLNPVLYCTEIAKSIKASGGIGQTDLNDSRLPVNKVKRFESVNELRGLIDDQTFKKLMVLLELVPN